MILQIQKNQISETDDKTWQYIDKALYLGCLLLHFSAIFISPLLFDMILVGVVNTLDFILSPCCYFAALAVIVVFSIKWFQIACVKQYDVVRDVDLFTVIKFISISIVIIVEFMILILLHETALLNYLFLPIWIWFRFGINSHNACLTLFCNRFSHNHMCY